MQEISLTTGTGDYVITAVIPVFHPMPEILIWGTRVFRKYSDHEFREVFAASVVWTATREQAKHLLRTN